nr:hypothetical protein [Corynebacterium auriscanis]
MLIDPEYSHSREISGIPVNHLAAGLKGDVVDQLPAHSPCRGGGGHADPVDGTVLENSPHNTCGQFRAVIGAHHAGLKSLSCTSTG